jgi:hypothetical protein
MQVTTESVLRQIAEQQVPNTIILVTAGMFYSGLDGYEVDLIRENETVTIAVSGDLLIPDNFREYLQYIRVKKGW